MSKAKPKLFHTPNGKCFDIKDVASIHADARHVYVRLIDGTWCNFRVDSLKAAMEYSRLIVNTIIEHD